MAAWMRAMLVMMAPLWLTGCFLSPGKFTSSLTLLADRTFTFTYMGEVIAIDPGDSFAQGMVEGLKEGIESEEPEEGAGGASLSQIQATDEAAAKKAATEAKHRAVADALRKEAGFRRAEYLGDGKFMIDYAITSRLTHGYVFPFNTDAQIVFPFIAVEPRAGGTARMTAPAFAKTDKGDVPGGGMDAGSHLDGTFTFVTDAEIVSQNSEDSARVEGGRKTITWRATPLTKNAPMAVVRFAP